MIGIAIARDRWRDFGADGLFGYDKLGEQIAAMFGQGHNIVILENHGMAAAGSSLLNAFQRLETLDFCARTLIRARGLGEVKALSDAELNFFDHRRNLLAEYVPVSHSSRERELRQQIVEIVRRAVDRYLMISTEGVVSARLDEGSFLITPTGVDRGSLTVQDVVLVCEGAREQGKLPSRSVQLHQAIYAAHPDVHCAMTAQCPNVTAYASTSTIFSSRAIPESYILLRDVPTIPFKALYTDPDKVAHMVSLSQPVLLAQNDCILVVGSGVLNAFDRLEVAEYGARSLIDAAAIGQYVPIGDDEIRGLEIAFSLSSS